MDQKSKNLDTRNQCGDTEQALDVPDDRSLSRQQVLERFNTLVWEKKLWLRERDNFTFQMANLKDELRRVKMLVADRESEMAAEQAKHRESTERYERTIACLKSGFQLQLEQANALHSRQSQEVERMRAFLEAEKVKCCEQQSEISNLEEQHGKISLLQQLLQNKVRDFEHQLSEKDNNIVNLRKNNDALCWDLEAAKQELLRYYTFLRDKFHGELLTEENCWLLPSNQTGSRSDPAPQEASAVDPRSGGEEETKVDNSSNQAESEEQVEEEEAEEEENEEDEEDEEEEEWREKQKKRKEKEEWQWLKKREKQERKLQKQAEKEAKKERKRRQKQERKEIRKQKQEKDEEQKQQQQPTGFWSFVLRRRRRRRRRQEQQNGDTAG